MSAIDSMPAGPELDAMVAVQVMGWTRMPDHVDGLVVHPMYRTPEGGTTSYPSAYSKNIAAAWDVVERMRALGLRPVMMPDWGTSWQCLLYRDKDGPLFAAPFTDSAPLAICRAALKAVAKR